MAGLQLSGVKKLFCLGAHSDDIEIGAGATILRLLEEQPGLEVYWFVFTAAGDRAKEAKQSAEEYLKAAGKHQVQIENFRESYFPSEWPAIKEALEKAKRGFNPDLVLTHCRDDRHQDHRVLSDLAWNTFRNHLVLEYEIPKYDGDLGTPNFYVPVTREQCDRKVAGLLKHFQTQGNKHWFTEDTFRALLRLRGIECASPTGFAEAFYGRKLWLAS